MSELYVLLLILGIAALWLDARRVQEIAVGHCRQACHEAGVQFLDEVASSAKFGFMRDHNGTLRLRRTYTFEYLTAYGERRTGSIVMMGRIPVEGKMDLS